MPLIMCPECRSSIPDSEPFCPECGRRMEAVQVRRTPPTIHQDSGDFATGGPERVGPVKVRRGPIDWKGRMGCLVALLVFALIVAAGSYVHRLVTPRYTPLAADAYKFGVMGVKSRLKARTNVRFPSVDQVEGGKVDANTFRFRGSYYIKSDSGGEAKEKPFTVVVQYTGSGEFNLADWEVLDVRY